MKYSTIQRFIDRVRQQARTQNKNFNMSMDDAQDLANELALVLLRENELLAEVSELKNVTFTDVIVGGGSFK